MRADVDENFRRLLLDRPGLKVDSSKDDLCLLLPSILDHYNLEQLLPYTSLKLSKEHEFRVKSLKMLFVNYHKRHFPPLHLVLSFQVLRRHI